VLSPFSRAPSVRSQAAAVEHRRREEAQRHAARRWVVNGLAERGRRRV